ncbi:MAG: DUF1848 family protein [Desulfobacterales bacterium]|nr:DUF1848 family protein [Desulfobacterales bacterium]
MKDNAAKIVISASRRTDIPAFYLPWFMAQVERGFFEVLNPFNRQASVIAASPDRVDTVVFWSKNFGPFLDGGFGETLQHEGYHLFFNFTVNSAVPLLEPKVPPLEERLAQLRELCSRFGHRAVNWRFDPICFYTDADGTIRNNMADFSRIASAAARCGIERCITSFMDDYAKIRRRIAQTPGFSFLYPDPADQRQIVLKMAGELAEKEMALFLCCEKELLGILPSGSGIRGSSCIPNDFLKELYGGNLSIRKDRGQRVASGCGCKVSVDIGSYQSQPCHHGCLFCYANPAAV